MTCLVSNQITPRLNGDLDIGVTLVGGRTHYQEGLPTRARVESTVDILRDLMTAGGASLVDEPAIRAVTESQRVTQGAQGTRGMKCQRATQEAGCVSGLPFEALA